MNQKAIVTLSITGGATFYEADKKVLHDLIAGAVANFKTPRMSPIVNVDSVEVSETV